jgi:inhibitor of KinA
MNDNQVKFHPLGESALIIEFGDKISLETNEKVINLACYFDENPFEGFIECVPAYASLTVFYDLVSVKKNYAEFSTAFETVRLLAEKALQILSKNNNQNARTIEIPVRFEKEFAPDLEFVAGSNNLTAEKVVEIFKSKIYRVYMLGFLPGFAYMGEIDERIATPRRKTPRVKVPEGSVGIAGRQTGIYPLESPGGWQIIGRTEIELFTPEAEKPTFLQPGDRVKFYSQTG